MLLLWPLLSLSLVYAQKTITLYGVVPTGGHESFGIEPISIAVGGVGPDGATMYSYVERVTKYVMTSGDVSTTIIFPTNSPQLVSLTAAQADSMERYSILPSGPNDTLRVADDVTCTFGPSSSGVCVDTF
ncbi:hypothetical protein HGRIS_014348 [Hohenbuehelia grisea]|uniref:Uncharacterized protein n=1 Tax=Hohenbuehelia grisea TaxID=104357 RepID=A0ABR3JT44_9AGAR